MKNFWKVWIIIGLQWFSVAGFAQSVEVGAVHYWRSDKQARMMVEVSAETVHRVALVREPLRLVIDINNANLSSGLNAASAPHDFFGKIKTTQTPDKVRIIAELKKAVKAKTYFLQPNKMYGHRLVVDLFEKEKTELAKKTIPSPKSSADIKASNAIISKVLATDEPIKKENKKEKASAKTLVADNKAKSAIEANLAKAEPAAKKTENPIKTAVKAKPIIVAIDAGHGGEDPGAHGANGTEEKKVVFAIAKRLEALINNQPGMKAVMVRKSDYFIDLRKRMKIARDAKADLFVSIHADAFQDADVSGASVFTLSNKGATSEAARWLASSENAADLIGGVKLVDKDDVLASVLLDLSQTATQEASVSVARKVLKNFEDIGELHYKAVQKAGFLVLKSPDIPSILVETAFISNPTEEVKLVNPKHQATIANAIFRGIRSYFKQVSPEDTRIASLL